MTEQLPLTFEQVYSTYYQRIYLRLYALLHNAQDAEDLTQETFLKAHVAFASRSIDNMSAWLYRVATNAAYDLLRRRRLKTFTSLESDEGDLLHLSNEDNIQETSVTHAVLEATLTHMRPAYRDALLLQYVEGYSLEEIAHVSNRGYAAARTFAYHARRDFKQHYQREVQACP